MCYYKPSNLPVAKFAFDPEHYVSNIRSVSLTNTEKHECNDSQQKVSKLVKSVMKIQKYKWSKNMSKFNECVKQLKVKYSVCDAARTIKMHYSQLHSLLSSKKKNQMAELCHSVQRKM